MCSTILFLGCVGEDSRRRSQLFGALVCFECIWRREKTKMSSHSSQNQLFKFPPTISTQHLISSLLDKYLPVKFWFRTVNGFRMSLIFTDNELSTKAIWSYSCTCARRTECSRQQILDGKVKWSKARWIYGLVSCIAITFFEYFTVLRLAGRWTFSSSLFHRPHPSHSNLGKAQNTWHAHQRENFFYLRLKDFYVS